MLGLVWLTSSVGAFETSRDGIDFFEEHIRPILVERCYECHSASSGEASGELMLDSRPAMAKGGTRGGLVDSQAPDRSLLLRAIDYGDKELQMPPSGKMPDNEISLLKRWVELGAPDPREDSIPIASSFLPFDEKLDKAKTHWAYQPLTPTAHEGAIDDMVLRRLAASGLKMSPEADRRTLVRRLYYDLLGLVPNLDDVQRWLDSRDDDWYSKLVEELLASPHFGERMARRWMDVSRYADTKGYVFQEERGYPHAYRYRDWLIRAFNTDMSYQDFVRYQLVADRLDRENASGNLDAMGLLTLGRRFLNNKFDVIDDRIDVITRGLLGMTAACARCHDHKFDPVSAADYYSLFSVLNNSEEPKDEPSPLRMVDREKLEQAFILLRGNPANRGPKVTPQYFPFLSNGVPRELSSGSGRLELADSIVDPEKPLAARVYVNRVWGWLLGQPLVDTPSDFGLRAEQPIYSDVLEHLTASFIAEGWSSKELIREIVQSDAYRQSSFANPQGIELDPENRWLWRAHRKRMDFESYRDAMLQVTGKLDSTVGGKSEPIHEPPFSRRRSVYAYIDRQNLPQLFRSFDFASPDVHSPQRSQTTVPQQGLVLMNSDMMQHVIDMVDIPSDEETDSDAPNLISKAKKLFSQIMARKPEKTEVERMVEFMKAADVSPAISPHNQWSYGYGRMDLDSGKLLQFDLFPYFDGKSWRGIQALPDEKLGWCMITATGGHPGKSSEYTSVRRWTVVSDSKIRFHGNLEHGEEKKAKKTDKESDKSDNVPEADKGDGIRAHLIHNQSKRLGVWTVRNGKVTTQADGIDVKSGDTLDMVVDCMSNESYDSYTWTADFKVEGSKIEHDSQLYFSGRQPSTPNRWRQLVQALLMTNEFCFVD